MKTTIDIPDPLLEEARRLAARESTTVKSLVQEGLRKVLAERKGAPAFRLRKGSFKGRGLRVELRDAPWEAIRAAAYEGRGG
jgi:putative antitoxin of VapBC-like toxin-antitoxin system